MNPLAPKPAIVKQVDSAVELIAEANHILGECQKLRRLDLEQTLKLGAILLKLKGKCKHGQWLPFLEKHNFGRSMAGEAIRASLVPKSVISTCESMADVRRLWRGQAEPEETEIYAPHTPPTNLFVLCPNCRWREESGKPMPQNCRDCAALNGGVAVATPAPPSPPAAPTGMSVVPTPLPAALPKPPPPAPRTPPAAPSPPAPPPADETPMECCPKCHGKGKVAIKPKREPKAPRPRDILFDAIAEACGADPHVSGSHIAKLKNLLAGADPPYTPEEVKQWADFVTSQSWWKGGKPGLAYMEKNIGQIRNGQGEQFSGIKDWLRSRGHNV